MKNVKQDLQEKINNYQNILRKTYGRAQGQTQTIQVQSKESDSSVDNMEDSSAYSCQNINSQKRMFHKERVQHETTSHTHIPQHHHSTIDNPRSSFCGSTFTNNKNKQSNLPQNLENIKQAYYSKMQALTQKLEDEKNRQRERSQHNRDRSKSMTIQNIQKYSNQINSRKQQDDRQSAASHVDPGTNGAPAVNRSPSDQSNTKRSISPYHRWKMMPRQMNAAKPNLPPSTMQSKIGG